MNNVLGYFKDIGFLYYLDEIIYLDRPIVFVLNDENNNLFVVTVVEFSPIEKWLLCPVTEDNLILALNGEITGYELFNNPENGVLFEVMVYANSDVLETNLISKDQVNKEWMPRDTFCFENIELIDTIKDFSKAKKFNSKYTLSNNKATSFSGNNELLLRFKDDYNSHSISANALSEILSSIQKFTNLSTDKYEKKDGRQRKNKNGKQEKARS